MELYNYPTEVTEAKKFFAEKIILLSLDPELKTKVADALWLDFIYSSLINKLKTQNLSQTYTHKLVDLQCEISGLRGLIAATIKTPSDSSLNKAIILTIPKIARVLLPETQLILNNPDFQQKLAALLPNPL